MKIVKVSDAKARDDSANPIFRGKVMVQDIVTGKPGEFRITQVNFSPGARNILHSHTFDQVLYVTEGKGILADEKTETVVTPGTVIFIPAGEKHWHGATKDSAFSHIAIMPPGETKF
jgi:quercetin dioxygenase-like cupin family protein